MWSAAIAIPLVVALFVAPLFIQWPTSTDATPPAAAPGVAPSVAAPADPADETNVRRAFDAYLAGLAARNVDALGQVWDMTPDQRAALRKDFRGMRSQRVEVVGTPAIRLEGDQGSVKAAVAYEIERLNRTTERRNMTTTLALRRTNGDRWIITDVAVQ
jgi:hypothetical protein